jgi:hypothetical protein
MVAFVTLMPTTTTICTQEGHLFYEGASGPGTTPRQVRDELCERPPHVRQETGNANYTLVIKCSLPYTADFVLLADKARMTHK